MDLIRDCFGHLVRLTDQRLEHILDMLRWPEWMVKSNGYCKRQPSAITRADDTSGYSTSSMPNPSGWEMVVWMVNYLPDDAFVITAYLIETIKAGETLWPKKVKFGRC